MKTSGRRLLYPRGVQSSLGVVVSHRHVSLRLVLPLALVCALLATAGAVVAAPSDERGQDYIVTLAVPDGGRAIAPAGRAARERIRQRALRATSVTDRLVAQLDVRPRHRYTAAVSGFSARLTPEQVARLRSDTQVATVRPARRFRIASQVVPVGIRRVKAGPPAGSGPDVDVDIAVLDTGIGPVGGGELNVQGGINCSRDGRGAAAWQDLYPGRHGTHVAGTAAARDNGIGTVGVAPGARLWSIRVFDAGGFGDETTIICGLDWAVSTHGPGAPPGTQPIDVINMSIQGPRDRGGPEACVGAGDPDPMHQAVCSAFVAGITLVAAAGNERMDASGVSPAGYDQVITVGAISDFDGQGGSQGAASCQSHAGERDDAYARYSNYGSDVDILAPGTCVVSTYPSASGDATSTLTGTSMSTPHVAGAVGLYLAAHPGTSPTQMRRIIQGAGRLDWLLKTDPRWSGVNDVRDPKRLLDVAALMDGPGLTTWVFPSSFKVGKGDRTRRVRVDVQRRGGYDGDVTLGVTGLPGAAADTTFDRPGTELLGLTGLGARLTLGLKPGGPDGDYAVSVEAQGSGGEPSASRVVRLVLDRSGPRISDLGARIRGGRTALGAQDSVAALVEWDARDELGSVEKNVLRRRIGNGKWRTIAEGQRQRASTRVRPGREYAFRVRSTDGAGNSSSSGPWRLRLLMRDSRSTKWIATDGWASRPRKAAVGGSLLVGALGGTGLTTRFDGSAIALVAPVGPNRGRLRARVDGSAWKVIDLKAARGADRRVVFSRRVPPGSHLLEIEVLRGRPAIDAVLIVR